MCHAIIMYKISRVKSSRYLAIRPTIRREALGILGPTESGIYRRLHGHILKCASAGSTGEIAGTPDDPEPVWPGRLFHQPSGSTGLG